MDCSREQKAPFRRLIGAVCRRLIPSDSAGPGAIQATARRTAEPVARTFK
jgi:hypothetical protein